MGMGAPAPMASAVPKIAPIAPISTGIPKMKRFNKLGGMMKPPKLKF
jgi:hypothetical protein